MTVESLMMESPFPVSMIQDLNIRGLHYGCGPVFHENWLNLDSQKISRLGAAGRDSIQGLVRCTGDFFFYREHGDSWVPFSNSLNQGDALFYLEHEQVDVLPFEDESFQYVYSEHFIEHIPFRSAISWLKEVRRILVPGGCVRISTPDLEKYMNGYVDPSKEFFREHKDVLEELFGKEMPARRGWMVNQVFYAWDHKWIYDFQELQVVARCAGFALENVHRCSYRKGSNEVMYELDQPGRADESIYVEFFK